MEGVDIKPLRSIIVSTMRSQRLELRQFTGKKQAGAEQRRGLQGVAGVQDQQSMALGDRRVVLAPVETLATCC